MKVPLNNKKKLIVTLLVVLIFLVLLLPIPALENAKCYPCSPDRDCPPCPSNILVWQKPLLLQLINVLF